MARLYRHLGMDAPGYHDRLALLEVPVLVVTGALAGQLARTAEQLATLVGDNATLGIMEATGHPAPFEQPKQFVELLRNFMAENPL